MGRGRRGRNRLLPRFCREEPGGCDGAATGGDLESLPEARLPLIAANGIDRVPWSRANGGCLDTMSTVTSQARLDACDPFHVVLHAAGTHSPVVLRTAPDANEATIAFHVARQQLTREQVAGELLLVRQGEGARTLLRESLR